MIHVRRLLVLITLAAAAALPAHGAEPSRAASAAEASWGPRPAPTDSLEALVESARSIFDEDPAAAARLYRRAARTARSGVSAWLRLSEAQAAARAGDTAAVRKAARALAGSGVVLRDSVRLELARAALEAGDDARGAELGRALDGAADPALWAERLAPALLARGDTTAARRGLLEAAEADPGAGAGRGLLELDPDWRTTARLARAYRGGGQATRAARLLGRVLERAPAGERADLWRERAGAELAAGRTTEAHRSARRGLESVRDPETRAELELLSARSHLARDQLAQAEVHLARGLAADGGDRSARAGYLLADLAHDRNRTAEARRRYRRVARAHPGTRHGGIARMRLGLLVFREGRHLAAAEHFEAYRRARPNGGWATASVYWEGRALAASGRTAEAETRLRAAVERDPLSWYGIRAAHRLGTEPLDAVFGEDEEERSGDAASFEDLLDRMDLLRRLGWTGRALATWATVDVDTLAGSRLELALRLNEAGWTGPGIRLGWSVFERREAWSRRLARAIWPLPHRGAVLAAAAGQGLPPALVAAVARQESAFDPRAVSRAGAVGLMQIMPATARDLPGAPADRAALMEPGVSLELGAGYLGSLIERFDGSVVGALVAYNAGPTRWIRWRRFPEADVDPELLVERIPFGETRRYVKAVLRNLYLYARLHGLEAAGGAPAAPTTS